MGFQGNSEGNYEVFRECVSGSIVENSEGKPARASKGRAQKAKRHLKDENVPSVAERADPEELADFIDVYSLKQLILTPLTNMP